ncbi:MAG: glycosyltransferase family 4 protein [Acidobacteria bacterium]|nr:glycosyltransferase family 4 protein [Acidobacteriota bacterium]
MGGLKVLIANATLASLTGTETYVRDLALGLLRKGHTPIVYAPELGELAGRLHAATVPVVDDLCAVGVTPDVIHGNHNTELMTALLHFPGVPAVFFCHSWTDWVSSPPSHPRVLAYVAVDDTCRDRLLCEHSIPEERLRVVLHAADLERFRPRGPLPARPRRALIFSNNANKWTHLAAVREACSRAGIELDVVGAGVDAQTSRPESLLGNYDLVFAKARCAQEALAVGAAVILCDARGSGPLVTANELEKLRRLNFGIRALGEKIDPDLLLRQIERYDAADAAEVSRRFRAGSDLGSVVDDAIALYGEVINEYRGLPPTDPLEETRAAAGHLRWLTLTTRRKQAECEAMLANSLTLRLRNRVGEFPLAGKLLDRLASLARRSGV